MDLSVLLEVREQCAARLRSYSFIAACREAHYKVSLVVACR
jgi:hypothetical protein